MPDELRNTRRARLSGVRVTIEGATGERHQAEVADLSKEGLFIVSETPLAIGKRLSLEIYAIGEPAPWPALGRVVWTRETGDGEERPPGMGVKIIDIDDAAAEAVDRLLETRERTEPGLGAADKGEPGREKTMLGVGVSAEPPLPAAPILVPAPGREATLLGVGMSGGAEPREPSVPIDLVAKKVSSAPPPAEAPAIARPQVDTEPPKSRKRSKKRGGLAFLLLALLAACVVAAYALRDRLLTLWQQASSTEVTTEAPRPEQAPVAAPAPSPTPTPTATVSPAMEAGAAPDAARSTVPTSAPSSSATATPFSAPSSGASSRHPAATQPPAAPPRKPKSPEDSNPY